MRGTRPTPLIVIGVLFGVLGFLVDVAAESGGRPTLVLPGSLPLTLTLAGVVVLAFAIPVRRAVRGTSDRRIDPFRAARLVVLAKACGIVGAAATGFAIGLAAFVVTRPVLPTNGAFGLSLASLVGGIVLLVCGLVAERFCRLPPDDRDDDRGGPPPGHPDRMD